MTEILMAFLGLFALSAAIAVAFCVARWILRPLDLVAKDRSLPFQFTVGDFLGLFFLVQIPTAVLMYDREFGWLFVAYGWIAFGLMWLVGVGTLSRAGIHNAWHRALFVAVVIPGSVGAAIGLPVSVLAIAASLQSFDAAAIAMALGCALAAVAAAYGLGRLTRRMVRSIIAVETPTGPRGADLGD